MFLLTPFEAKTSFFFLLVNDSLKNVQNTNSFSHFLIQVCCIFLLLVLITFYIFREMLGLYFYCFGSIPSNLTYCISICILKYSSVHFGPLARILFS